MSTSPSWFDQEKFSRLVKKVGPKAVPEAIPVQPAAETENRPSPASQTPADSNSTEKDQSEFVPSQASTAHISLVSKPPSLLSEHRALPALPRRTSPLPALKSLFQYSTPPLRPAFPGQVPAEAPVPESPIRSFAEMGEQTDESMEESESETPRESEASSHPEGDGLSEAWQKMAQLNEELAHTILERDHALEEAAVLREQLRTSDEAAEKQEHPTASPEEITQLTQERDQARTEIVELREQLSKVPPPESVKEPGSITATKELVLLTDERDQARREYAKIREQFEALKLEHQAPREDSSKFRKELEQQVEGFRLKLEERNREIASLKANPATSGGASNEELENLKQEMTVLREQLTRAKEEMSIAQRGLALSQKALRETRDTLREATEGTSLSRHNFDNLKNECATLVQQNTVLQAQNEQLLRDLSATKSKLTTRL